MKKLKLFFYFYFIFLFILFFIGLFLDFQISQAFAILENNKYFSTNFFAIFVEIFGELPFYILISFCFVVFCTYSKKIEYKPTKTLAQFSLFLCAITITFLAFLRTSKFAKSYVNISIDALTFIALAIIAILINLSFLLITKKIQPQNLKKLFFFSLMIVIVAIISVFVVQIIKNNICVRARFRTINYLGDKSLFNPCWNLFENVFVFDPNLPEDAFKSFPSGHTMTASIFFGFVFLPVIFNIKSRAKHLYWILPIIFISTVAIGRIIAGAHFLTDVTFSAIFAGILYVILFNLIFNKQPIFCNKKNASLGAYI